MRELTFNGFWEKMRGTEISDEELSRESYIHGASSILGFLISSGMLPPMLEDVEEAIREAKKGMGEKRGRE